MTGNRGDSRQTVTGGDSDRVWWCDGSDGRLLQVKVPTSELSFLNFSYGFLPSIQPGQQYTSYLLRHTIRYQLENIMLLKKKVNNSTTVGDDNVQ